MSELVKEKLKDALAFGHGKLVVEKAAIYGKPAVVINKAVHGGVVGQDASKEDHIPTDDLLDDTILLTFPTMEQAQRVSDVLVNHPTPLEQELLEALKGLIAAAEMTTFSDQFPAECEAANRLIAKAEGQL